jgi:hypothetical protein
MILTGDKLDEIGRAVWGAHWPSVLAARLERSRWTLFDWRKRPTGHPKAVKRALLKATEDQLAIVAAYVEELREDVGP